MTPPPQSDITALTYTVPATYCNNVSITQLNGLVRLTFFEQVGLLKEFTNEPMHVVIPRCAVMLTPETAAMLMAALKQCLEVPSDATRN